MYFRWLGGHDTVENRILRETVLEGKNHVAIKKQPLTFAALRYIGQLVRGDAQLLCQDFPVAGGLVQHIDIIAVFEDVFDLLAGQQVLDVLCDAGRNPAPFAEAFPDLHAVGGCLFFPEQKVELVHIVTGCLSFGPVFGDPAPYLVLYDQHAELFELLAELLDVIADQTVLNVYVCAVVEYVERTGDVDFKGSRQGLGFSFILFSKRVVQVFQDRNIFRTGVVQVGLVDDMDGAVDDGFFNRLQSVPSAYDEFAQGKDEVLFQGQWVFVVAVVQVDVHGVDIGCAGG